MSRTVWRFRIREPDGSIRQDHMRAESADEVIDALRIQEVEVLSIEQVDALDDRSPEFGDRGPLLEPSSGRPPPVPREPSDYMASVFKDVRILVGGLFVMVSSVFIVIGLGLLINGNAAGVFMTLFPLIHFTVGAVLLTAGLRKRAMRREVIAGGAVELGTVTKTGRNRRTRVNGKHPFLIDYDFKIDGTSYSGQRSTLDDRITGNRIGDRVWVLHDPADPNRNVLWPPV